MSDEQPNPSSPDEGFQTETWTFVGKCQAFDKSIGFVYLDATGEERVFSKAITGSVVGAQYDVQVKRDGDNVRVQRERYRWKGMHPDSAKINRWSAEHQATVTMLEALALERKAGAVNRLLGMTLSELAAEYRRLPTMRRRALLATILSLLTTFKKIEKDDL